MLAAFCLLIIVIQLRRNVIEDYYSERAGMNTGPNVLLKLLAKQYSINLIF